MPPEPSDKRTIAFFDGQNLFYAAKAAFGYSYPNYDPLKLAEAVVRERPGWHLTETYFKVASAFPIGSLTENRRGINRTDWIRIDRATYDACIDPLDYRRPLHEQQ